MVLLIKFGKQEHLEQLKNGIVHFSPIELFQEDPTDFRGDKMEGKHYIDTSKPFLMNGTDISMYIKEAVASYELNCPVCSFSASLLSYKNCHIVSEGEYAPNDDFIAEMKKFGDYFLLFNAFDFIDSLAKEFEITGCGYEYHPMPNIKWWHRNISRQGFVINGSTRAYPDLIAMTTGGKILMIETKGDHLDNDDSKAKAKIGQQWDMLAGSKYRYFMVFQSKAPDFQGAYSYDRFMEIVKKI